MGNYGGPNTYCGVITDTYRLRMNLIDVNILTYPHIFPIFTPGACEERA